MSDNTNTETGRKYNDREAWLQAAIEIFRPRFVEAGFPIPDNTRISVGFGPTGARKENAIILGVTLNPLLVEDGATEIWISPEDADTASMLGTVIHELIHAAVGVDAGHEGDFAEVAVRLGLEGKMTATTASLGLAVELMTIAETLGEYPGSRVDLSMIGSKVPVGPDGNPIRVGSAGPKSGKQGTRMIKVACTNDQCACGGYTVRTTEKWLAVGLPSCPMGTPMERQ